MLIKFETIKGAHLYIRSEDLRRLQDSPEGALVGWIEGELPCSATVKGSAEENYARLADTERAAAEEYERRQLAQRMAQMPMARSKMAPRGKQR